MADHVERAVQMLLDAGLKVRYRSRHGASWYLGMPDRSGCLRVSDHSRRAHQRPDNDHTVARLTLHEASTPTTEESFCRAVALALGQYMLRSAREKADV